MIISLNLIFFKIMGKGVPSLDIKSGYNRLLQCLQLFRLDHADKIKQNETQPIQNFDEGAYQYKDQSYY